MIASLPQEQQEGKMQVLRLARLEDRVTLLEDKVNALIEAVSNEAPEAPEAPEAEKKDSKKKSTKQKD